MRRLAGPAMSPGAAPVDSRGCPVRIGEFTLAGNVSSVRFQSAVNVAERSVTGVSFALDAKSNSRYLPKQRQTARRRPDWCRGRVSGRLVEGLAAPVKRALRPTPA